MKRNILVVGGSYFIGRMFVQQLAGMDGYSVHVLNRGRIPLHIPGVTEYACNRRELNALKKTLPKLIYDTVIDFCARYPIDIKALLENLPGRIRQYILISSCSVYETSNDYPKTEDSPMLSAQGPGLVGEYAFNKRLLEAEAKDICNEKNIPLTILRPTLAYGPYNYCPGESYFFDLLLSGQSLSMPENSLSLFQLVYVRDIVQILIKCMGRPEVFDNEYILAAPEFISYTKLANVLAGLTDRELETEFMSPEEIEEKEIPLPFPLKRHELYSGEKIARTLGFTYTPFASGMREAFSFYKKNLISVRKHFEKINEGYNMDISRLKIY